MLNWISKLRVSVAHAKASKTGFYHHILLEEIGVFRAVCFKGKDISKAKKEDFLYYSNDPKVSLLGAKTVAEKMDRKLSKGKGK